MQRRGVHDASTAELALTLTLSSIRGIPEFVASQGRSHWEPLGLRSALADSRVLVVGYGQIGRRRAPARALRGRPDGGRLAAAPATSSCRTCTASTSCPTCCRSTTSSSSSCRSPSETRGLFDAAFLGRMPDGALLVNVARGPVVDTDALVAECASGRLRAALDVTDPEPLPEGHPLWTTPGVLITPHVGGATPAMRPRALALVRRQVQPLLPVSRSTTSCRRSTPCFLSLTGIVDTVNMTRDHRAVRHIGTRKGLWIAPAPIAGVEASRVRTSS